MGMSGAFERKSPQVFQTITLSFFIALWLGKVKLS